MDYGATQAVLEDPIFKESSILTLLFGEIIPNFFKNSLKTNFMALQLLTDQIQKYCTYNSRNLPMANFVTRGLNALFKSVDQKLQFHLDKSFNEAHIWRASVMSCTSVLSKLIQADPSHCDILDKLDELSHSSTLAEASLTEQLQLLLHS